MKTDGIFFLEGFAQVIAGLQTEHSGIFCIDSHMRSSAGVSGFSLVTDIFRHAAVHSELCVEVEIRVSVLIDTGSLCHSVDHHCHIDTVQETAVHELGLAAVVFYDPFLAELLAEGQLDHFLGRYSDETDRSA